ncbi:MAG: hypothetical protein K6T31_07835 [Alicyclobacillus sp.]|nr:hypothetical protein [Alicyclobacillus sp.]
MLKRILLSLLSWCLVMAASIMPAAASVLANDPVDSAGSGAVVSATMPALQPQVSLAQLQPVALRAGLSAGAGGGYRSGYRTPSASAGSYSFSRPSASPIPNSSGWGSHLFSFGAGWLLGSMFHPFGYGVWGGYHSFSLFGLIFDLLLLYLLWRLVRWLFLRR